MKTKALVSIYILMIFSLVSCSKESINETGITDNPSVLFQEINSTEIDVAIDPIEEEILTLVNEYRSEIGATTLAFSMVAYKEANEHTMYMISKGTLSHDNFSSRATNINDIELIEHAAENVARDFKTAKDVLHSWLESTHHKRTIESDFTHSAISVKQNVKGMMYFTQIFYKK